MITGIHLSSSEMILTRDEGKKPPLPLFVKNQKVRATVLKMMPPGNAQLLINGQKVVAKTSMLLKPGEEVQLKVLAQKDAVVLKLIAPVQKMTRQQISSLVRFISKNDPLSDVTGIKQSVVKDLLYDMALKSGEPEERFLPKLMDKSGLLWEKKVAQTLLGKTSASDINVQLDRMFKQDMKGHILKELLMADAGKFETMKSAVGFSETLENFQLLNHHSSDTGRWLLPFPIFNESVFRFGQLFIDTGRKRKKQNKTVDTLIRISFLLDMTRLGPLRGDFSILKNEITGRFLFKDEVSCAYVRSMIPDLETRLATVDYQVRKIECVMAKAEDIQQTCFIEALVNDHDDSIFNIVI
ncbi:hypothetical protein [Desulfobacula sp.]|uniref:hypothetical protein n=1 Tax=Desulfobacula sp. TaxID=2593537 RepID=UPI00261C33C6|nr:hypothetical protein [Desulfobacula sp.]